VSLREVCRPASFRDVQGFRIRRSIDKIDLHVRLSETEERVRRIQQQFGSALTASDAAQAKDDLRQVVIQAGQLLNRAEEGRAEVLAEVESLRAELEQFRTTIGSAIGVELGRH
jgi:hypothetical protein